MTLEGSKEQQYFERAFALAYYIHVNKEVAFFVAEDALDGLASTLGQQEKNRRPSERLRGFLKWGERTRPTRKTLKLNELQMLQWLVYKHSESWERQTERDQGLYQPTEEDLIVRYIEHLVFITQRRGSFYVTLAIGTLLHQFSRRETRLFYDILTQSDSPKMKDANYIGKQRLKILERVSQRFGDMVQVVNRPGEEKQFLMRPTTQWIIDLVNESLRRFTPWETDCVVEPGFEVTDIPGLYFSETTAHDEDLIEINRIRTVLDPACFARFADGLSKYVRTLPSEDQDKGCNYDSREERLAVPQFSNFPGRTPRGDRLQPQELTREDYVRLQRMLEARAHRKKAFSPRKLSVYVDDVLSYSFDLEKSRRGRFLIGAEDGVIEVRGQDDSGELTLVTLPLGHELASGEVFRGSVLHPGGQKITLLLTPVKKADGAVEGAHLEVRYTEPRLMRSVSGLVRRAWFKLIGTKRGYDQASQWEKPGHTWLARAAVILALVIVSSALVWWLSSSGPPLLREARRLEPVSQPRVLGQAGGEKIIASATPSPPPAEPPTPKKVATLVASAAWSKDREEALGSVPVEPTRGERRMIDLALRRTKVTLSLPLYDDEGRLYSGYRLTLSAAGTRLWQQTLRPPKVSLTGYAHILALSLFTRQMPEADSYVLKVEGRNRDVWRSLGQVTFNPKGQ